MEKQYLLANAPWLTGSAVMLRHPGNIADTAATGLLVCRVHFDCIF